MIESMDNALGTIVNKLKEENILDNTIIIFMSDNGGLSAVARQGEKHKHNYPLKSGKGSIYEGGIRVPMIVYSPFHDDSNKEVHQPVIIDDFFPSILELTNSISKSVIQKIDGRSFVPLLNNEKYELKPLFWHYPNWWGPSGPGIGSYSAVRNGDWKLIYFHHNQTIELYNLKDDIFENNNLVLKENKKRIELSNMLTNYLISVDAQMPFNKLKNSVVPWPNEISLNNEEI